MTARAGTDRGRWSALAAIALLALVAALAIGLAASLTSGGSALAAPPGHASPGHAVAPSVAHPSVAHPSATVDGVRFGYLPGYLGRADNVSYDFERVDFTSRVWESRRPAGGWRVDLDLLVMRGSRLHDGASLRYWFVRYEQRPPAETHYTPVRVHGHPGWLCRDQLFWLVRPGLAVSVQLDRSRWTVYSVVRTGFSAAPVG